MAYQDDIRRHQAERATLLDEQRALLALGTNRTSEQEAKLDELIDQETKLERECGRLQSAIDAEARLEAETERKAKRAGKSVDEHVAEGDEYTVAFSQFMLHGMDALSNEQRAMLRSRYVTPSASPAVNANRAFFGAQTVTTTGGGYLIPERMMGQIEVAKLRYGSMLELGDIVHTDTGEDYPWPTVDDTSSKGAILPINTAAGDGDLTFGQQVLRSFMYTSLFVKIPIQLSQDSGVNVEALAADLLGLRLGRIYNQHFTTGNGSGQPSGVITGATSGVTAASASAITDLELIDLEHSVDEDYRIGGSFQMKDSTLKAIKKLVNGDGNQIWTAGLAYAAPNTILGYPYKTNSEMAAITNSAKVIAFGDFKKYKIRFVNGGTLLRLAERFADAFQIGLIMFERADGLLLDAGTHPVKYLEMHS